MTRSYSECKSVNDYLSAAPAITCVGRAAGKRSAGFLGGRGGGVALVGGSWTANCGAGQGDKGKGGGGRAGGLELVSLSSLEGTCGAWTS